VGVPLPAVALEVRRRQRPLSPALLHTRSRTLPHARSLTHALAEPSRTTRHDAASTHAPPRSRSLSFSRSLARSLTHSLTR
jgi:hypothetical protein